MTAPASSSTLTETPAFDVAVIGGGLLGCFAARNLMRWKLSAVLLEARADVCSGISRANTAIVYPGYDNEPGSLKAEMTVRAGTGFGALCDELGVRFSRCGSLMVSYGPKADGVLRRKLQQGVKNGVKDLRLLSGEAALALEPALARGVSSALYSPGAGTVNPWELGLAACENALANGAKAYMNTPVTGISRAQGGYIVHTSRGSFSCRAVINCAGLSADKIQELLFPPSVQIAPTAADYLVLDKAAENAPAHIIQYEPEYGRGFSAVPTVDGSLLLGPSERENTADYATDPKGLSFIIEQTGKILPGLSMDMVIRSFAAVRPNSVRPDGRGTGSFVIENPGEGFWSFIGIKTPGMTCAQELGTYGADKAAEYLGADINSSFCPIRTGIKRAHGMSLEQRKNLIASDPDYGEVICHCEDITKAEILEAIRRGAVTVDGIKRRTGAAMGRCQGGRCQQELTSLLARELGIDVSRVTKDGPGSVILGGRHGTL